jgi:diadenylate cyclase
MLTDSAFDLGKTRTGALFVIEGDEPVASHIVPGTELQALPSERFLISLFNSHNPLHDGAVILSGDRVTSAGNFLPISESTFLDKQLGTRHRAAVGLTERCDAVVVVVSEETGSVRIAFHGRLSRRLNEHQFVEQLNALVDPNPNFSTIVPRASMI